MRVAVVSTSWPSHDGDPSGHFVVADARALEREGHEVVVVVPRAGGAFGWPGVAARLRERPYRSIEAMAWPLRARRHLARHRVDRVVAHWSIPSAWPITPRGVGLDVVSHGGDVRLLGALPAPVRERIVSSIATRAERWRFVSAALHEELAAKLPPRVRAMVDRVAEVRACAIEMPEIVQRARGEGPLAVAVGRLVASKRFEAVIDRVARGGEKLVVVGDGPERARLERHARARGVDAQFVGLLPRHETLAWIASADVLLHASRTEGLSTVVREAEALGTRVEHL